MTLNDCEHQYQLTLDDFGTCATGAMWATGHLLYMTARMGRLLASTAEEIAVWDARCNRWQGYSARYTRSHGG